jgi:MFS family permease
MSITTSLKRANDRWLITPKLMYFTMNMVVYSFHLFRGAFITDYLLLDSKYVGLSGTLMGLVSFPCITMWSSFADAIGRHKFILSTITVGSVICFEMLFFRMGSLSLRLLYSMTFLVLYSAFLAGMQPLLDYEALELLSCKAGFSKEIYGRQRLWGTIAYSCVTLGGAYLIKLFDGFGVLAFIMPAAAIVFIITLYFTALPDRPKPLTERARREYFERQKLEQKVAHEQQLQQQEQQQGKLFETDVKLSIPPTDSINNTSNGNDNNSPSSDPLTDPAKLETPESVTEGFVHRRVKSPWRTLLTDANYMFFLFVVLMLGLARAVMTIFLALVWKTELKMTTMEVAVAGAIFGMALEIVVFFLAKYISPIMGNYWMLVAAQMAMVVRCWAYFFMPKSHDWYWLVYIIELLKGFSFGMAHSAAIKIANEAAPEGLEATAQALYNSVYVQLPTIISGLVGMWAFHQFKSDAPQYIFFGTSVISTAALVLFFVKYSIDGKIRLKFWC